MIRVDKEVVAPENVEAALRQRVRNTTRTKLLLEFDDEVPHGSVVRVQDAAQGAGMEGVTIAVPKR